MFSHSGEVNGCSGLLVCSIWLINHPSPVETCRDAILLMAVYYGALNKTVIHTHVTFTCICQHVLSLWYRLLLSNMQYNFAGLTQASTLTTWWLYQSCFFRYLYMHKSLSLNKHDSFVSISVRKKSVQFA